MCAKPIFKTVINQQSEITNNIYDPYYYALLRGKEKVAKSKLRNVWRFGVDPGKGGT